MPSEYERVQTGPSTGGEGDEPGSGQPGEIAQYQDQPAAIEAQSGIQKLATQLLKWANSPNIAPDIAAGKLSLLGQECCHGYEIDRRSRQEWERKSEKFMSLALQRSKPKTFPWPKACYSLDTDILTKSGWQPIGDIRIGEMVLSRGPDGTADFYPVTQTFRHRAEHMVHFKGKSIDLLVTPNHRMVVNGYRGKQKFIEAIEFLKSDLSGHYIPLISTWNGTDPAKIYGIDARAYMRFIGWFISEGYAIYGMNSHENLDGTVHSGPTTGGFGIAQSLTANPEKYEILRRDIEACGFTCRGYQWGFTVHARSMPEMLKDELRSMGRSHQKYIPRHALALSTSLLENLLETLVAGDGAIRKRAGKIDSWSYYTTSILLADQIQEVAQKVGRRATIAMRKIAGQNVVGGIIRGRQIKSLRDGYAIEIANKTRIKVNVMHRRMIEYDQDVACVEVAPHHTVFVRRNGKAVWCGNSNIIWPLLSQAVNEFAAAIYPVIMDGDRVVKGKTIGSDKGEVDQAKLQAMMQQLQQMAIAAQQQANSAEPGTTAPQGQPDPMAQPGAAPPQAVPGPGIPPAGGMSPEPPPIPYLPGKEPGAKRRRADRVSEHMSWQLLVEQEEWQADSDRLFRALPILGCAARKSWFDPVWGRNCSMYVSMMDLVVNYHAKSLQTAPRLTEVFELYPYEIEERIRSEEFIDFEAGTASTTEEQQKDGRAAAYMGDRYAPHLFLEQHCFWDLDDDGYDEPYTVTIHKQSQKVVRVTARYEADGIRLTKDKTRIAKIDPLHYYTLFQFMPNPESAIYGHGFGHVLGPINESLNSAINQLFDAGTLQNVQGGFIGSGLSMHSGAVKFKMGELKPVNATGISIRDSIYIPDFKGPSIVMFQMFGLLVEAGRELAGIKAVTTGAQSPASTDPATMMAMLEQGMRVFKDVYKRVLRGLNQEYAKLFTLNRKYMPEQGFQYQKADEQFDVTAEDYASTSGVETVGDPNLVTDMQRLARAQLIAPFKDDARCDGKEIIRRIFQAGNIEDIDAIVLEKPVPNPFAIAELQLKQAELAGALVKQQKDHAQSILFLMQAKEAAAKAENAPLAAQIDAQMEREWLNIEKANSQIGALSLVVDAHKAEAAMIKAKKDSTKKAA